MKKIKKYFLAITLVLSMILMSGCSKKVAITAEDFNKKMVEKGYKVSDTTNNLSNVKVLKKSFLAIDSDYRYQIEFYELKSEEDAKTMFKKNKDNIEDSKGSVVKKQISINTDNYDKYTVITNGKHYVVIRVGNTMIFANNDEMYEKEIKSIVDLLGY